VSNIIIIFGISDRSEVKLYLFFGFVKGQLERRAKSNVCIWLFFSHLTAILPVICMEGIKLPIRPFYPLCKGTYPGGEIVRQGGPK